MRRLTLVLVLLAAGCTGATTEVSVSAGPATTAGGESVELAPASTTTLPEPTLPAPPPALEAAATKTTHHRLDGNRYAAGVGAIPQSEPTDLTLPGAPRWVVGVAVEGRAVWLVALEDGRVVAVDGSSVGDLDAALPPGAPFAARVTGEGAVDVIAAGPGESPLTHPIFMPDRVAVLDDGRVRFGDTDVAAGALPDARIVAVAGGDALVLGGATDAYPHGVLGDPLEASTLAFVGAGGTTMVDLPPGLVAEGQAPIWADLDGDRAREVVVTLSDDRAGARIVALDGDGATVAAGPPIGRGGRWRHQIAVAPFGPGGELELVAVRTPHIGGVAEFYERRGDRLEIVAEAGGVTSHVIGSRNLDLALAADADGDGRVELVAPTDDLASLAGVRRTESGAAIAWIVPLGARLATNLAAVELPGGTLEFAAGTAAGVLRVWPALRLDTSPEAATRRMLADVDALLADGPRVAGTPAEAAAADRVLATLRGWHAAPATETVELPTGGVTRNIWVAAGRGDAHVLLGAHYDSKEGSPGADDNASGVAVLLELARRLAVDPPAGLTVDLVFFGGEEIPAGFPADRHHFGSRRRAAEMEAAGMLPDYMVSVDQVGFDPALLAVTFGETDPAAADALAAAAESLGVAVMRESRGDISDHEAFARRGVPSVFMWRPDNPAYHTPEDVTVRPDLLLEDLAILELFLRNLAAG